MFVLLLSCPDFFVTDYEVYVCWEIEGVEGGCADVELGDVYVSVDGAMPAAKLILANSSLANLTNYYD